jgi:hypothetical protein
LVAHADSLRKEGEIVLKSDLGDQTTHQAILTDLKNRKSEFGTALDATPHFTTLSELQKWLTERLAGNKNADEIAATYIQLFLQKRYGSAADSFKEVNSEFQKSGFDLLPNPYPSLLSGKWSWPRRHLLGILVSAALLSLGAPFWFNTLKSLTNLRPKLAEEIDKDPKQIPQNSGTK